VLCQDEGRVTSLPSSGAASWPLDGGIPHADGGSEGSFAHTLADPASGTVEETITYGRSLILEKSLIARVCNVGNTSIPGHAAASRTAA
jgi:hypothetical protein